MPAHRSIKIFDSHSNRERSPSLRSQYFHPCSESAGQVILNSYLHTRLTVNSGYTNFSSYPVTPEQRAAYRTVLGKRLTPYQWAVYNFVLTIPKGKVTTYKDLALAIGGSPRSVGNALRLNPFSPHIPCHRVIASNLFLGGFFGEWGKKDKTGQRYDEKILLLSQEGVHFSSSGILLKPEDTLWKPTLT